MDKIILSQAQRCPALLAPLRPRDEQDSALSWVGFQEGTATSGVGCERIVSLSILFEEKNGLWDALFLSFLCLIFSAAVCSKRQKRWIKCNDFSSHANTQVAQMQVSRCQACFSIIQLHEQPRKETAMKFVNCQEKLNSWRARRVGGEHAGAEGRRR